MFIYIYINYFLIHLNIGVKKMLRKFNLVTLFSILIFKVCEGMKGGEGIHLRPIENYAVFSLPHSLSCSFLIQGLLKGKKKESQNKDG